MRQCDSGQCTQESYLIQLLVRMFDSHTAPDVKGTSPHAIYGTLRRRTYPGSPPAGHTIRHGTLRPRETIRFCVLSPARALRAPAPRRAEQPRVTSRSGVLRAFRPSRAPLTARSPFRRWALILAAHTSHLASNRRCNSSEARDSELPRPYSSCREKARAQAVLLTGFGPPTPPRAGSM